ncbi:hypothetical protein [Heyndrickxia sporothermodurans]|uniref:hypothetical protein n=1 Tax=Heyndrickxia sporothermodurans TaxID=46224 RepID=UPI0035DAC853
MNHFLLCIQLLCLAFIIGGGAALGGTIRPLFTKAMVHSKAVHELESLHISVWNAYNRFSLIAISLFVPLQIISFTITKQFQILSISLSFILVVLFLIKIIIDAHLKKRALDNNLAFESSEQKNDHKKVEYISILILILSTIEIFVIQ